MTRYALTVDGRTRSYVLHAPEGLKSAPGRLPLVVALHQGGGRAEYFARLTHLDEIAAKEGVVVVFPQAFEGHWNDGRTRTGFAAFTQDIDDVKFITQVVADVTKRLGNIDTARVYVTGMANGGMMAYRVGCEAAEVIAGIAAVAANLPTRMRWRCEPKGPVSVLIMNGTNDPLMPWRGGEFRERFQRLGSVLSAEETALFWARHDNCETVPQDRRLDAAAPADVTQVYINEYAFCRDSRVVLYRIDQGGHTWPGGLQYQPETVVGKTSRHIDAGVVIWSFFKSLKAK
jgi:polyhydroxybutyrate depolymerase